MKIDQWIPVILFIAAIPLVPFVGYITAKVISYAWLRGQDIYLSEKAQQLGDDSDGKE